ncbi:MAG: hypothetical protein JWP35_3554 [Caulobacter sp.]|nr:hypothetical protein [Caulobacter sp.]
MFYFSASTGGFYITQLHGPRTMTVPDPAWVQPQIQFTTTLDDGEVLEFTVDDEAARPPMMEVPNPACRIPEDAVEVEDGEHRSLMAAQSSGWRIVAASDGGPGIE